jgi:RNA polymerase sigma-70 factor (ECF subfamily)
MITAMAADDPQQTRHWLERVAAGDPEAWRRLVEQHHARLRRMVALRMDPRLQGRVDPSDVLQEAYLEAAEHLPGYLENPSVPFFLWLRSLAGNRLSKLHRRHLGAQMRAAGREVPLDRGARPAASSAALAAQLLGRDDRPSEAAVRDERRRRLQEALNQMDPLDRDVLALRHFEQLTTPEVARELGISEAAAGKRYLRAAAKLKVILAQLPGGLSAFRP